MNWDLFCVIIVYIIGCIFTIVCNEIGYYITTCIFLAIIILAVGGSDDDENKTPK